MEYLKLLQLIVKPPKLNPYVFSGDWDTFLQTPNVHFSADWIEFNRIYGSGILVQLDEMQVYSPFHIDADSNWLSFATRIGSALNEGYDRNIKKVENESVYEYFPRQNGLIPIGSDNNGFVLSLNLKNGIATMVLHDSRTWYETFDMGFCEFLYKILTKEVKSAFYDEALIDSENDVSKRFIPR